MVNDITDETRYHITKWSRVAGDNDAMGSDVPGAQTMARALLLARDYMETNWEGVRALLVAAAEVSQWFSPVELGEIVGGYVGWHASISALLRETLREEYNDLPLRWLSTKGIAALKKQTMGEADIWVDKADIEGVYVFRRPGF